MLKQYASVFAVTAVAAFTVAAAFAAVVRDPPPSAFRAKNVETKVTI